DYIKVIDGNYDLSFDVKLKNVNPYNSRFGSRLLDAVNIRMFYYDKNKIRLSGKIYNPEKKKYIDHEFKALPFTNFWMIDSLGWIRANGITCKFPSPDGDIPEETKYVRIFFGLKGSGTMWVDNVNLQYTKQNFAVKEFLEPYKDTVFTKADLIIPTPQHVREGERVALFNSEGTSFRPLILIPENADSLTKKAANELKQNILKVSENVVSGEQMDIPVTSEAGKKTIEDASIVFSIGTTSLYHSFDFQKKEDSIDAHNEGYIITKAGNETPVICLKGSSEAANFYATQTVNQLIDKEKAEYHHAEIIDYPDFKNRAVVSEIEEDSLQEKSELMAQFRFTHFYSKLKGGKNPSQAANSLEALTSVKERNNSLKPGLALNPYKLWHKADKTQKSAQIPNLSNIIDYLKKAESKGINDFVVHIDDTFSPANSSSCVFNFKSKESHLKYRNLLDVHTNMMNVMAEELSEQADIKFLPLWNNSECIRKSRGKGELYLKELYRKIPGKIDYLWRGASKTPSVIDEVEIMHIKSIIDKYPVLYSKDINPYSNGNSKFAQNYPGKLRTTSFFQPFDLNTPGNFEQLNNEKTFIADIENQNTLDKIKLACYADYLWNGENYESNRSLLKVLVSNYGKESTFALLEFNDLYKGLQEMLIKMNKLDAEKKYLRSAKNIRIRMDNQMERLKELLKGTSILEDIQQLDKEIKKQYNEIAG
ncbi:MAG: beta-N-acetylglucosaminidase domain-containing protein, partial [Bacteroidota bacterium]